MSLLPPEEPATRIPRRLKFILGYMAFIFCLVLGLMKYASLHQW